MSLQVQAFANGFPVALLHILAGLAVLAAAGALYAAFSPAREIGHIREGNPAAAVSFGGVLFALAAPVATALLTSTSLVELGLWGVSAALLCLILFRVADWVLHGLPQRVQEGETAAAVLLTAARLAIALIVAAAIAV